MKIWFNHWFSTAYHLIELIRSGFGEPIAVVGSNSNPLAVYRAVCDEWYAEEDLPEEAYVDFCLNFCRDHEIDVFVPRRQLAAIAAAGKRFEAAGVRLFAERDAQTVALLDDKIASYGLFEKFVPEAVPPYRIANSFEEFETALSGLAAPGRRLCYKLAVDEGARSFRVIDDSIESIGALYAKPGSKITAEAAGKIMRQYDFRIPMIVMPYLKGADVSVDCLCTPRGRIILPRFKVGRYSEVRPDGEIDRICSRILDALPLEMPANIQFKMDGDQPYLLEINPRMSGGLQLSCLATGINLPALAMEKLLGLEMREWAYPRDWKARGLLNLETPVMVK